MIIDGRNLRSIQQLIPGRCENLAQRFFQLTSSVTKNYVMSHLITILKINREFGVKGLSFIKISVTRRHVTMSERFSAIFQKRFSPG